MLILTDRVLEAKRIQQTLQRVRPCAIAAVHQALAQPAVFSTLICDVALDSARSLDLVKAALAHHRTRPDIPVLFLLRDPSLLTQEQARIAGATASVAYPISAERLVAVVASLAPCQTGRVDTPAPANTKAAAEDVTATLANIFSSGARRRPVDVKQLDKGAGILLGVMKQATIQNWLDVVYAYDDTTYQHCLLVAGLTAAFALELGLQPQAQQLLVQAALIHDIGKASIAHEILNKPDKLSTAEMAVMRTHPAAGHEMIRRQADINPVLVDVVRHHHEFLDGTGYPDGLHGDQISRPVRMSTICDIYAALVERRPYKAPCSPAMALAYLDALGPKLDRPLLQAFRGVVADRELGLASGA